MAHLLQLPRELLTFIFCILETPKAFSMTCRALYTFSKDPTIISSWILNAPMAHRLVHAKKVFLKVPVLDCLVFSLHCMLKQHELIKMKSLRRGQITSFPSTFSLPMPWSIPNLKWLVGLLRKGLILSSAMISPSKGRLVSAIWGYSTISSLRRACASRTDL